MGMWTIPPREEGPGDFGPERTAFIRQAADAVVARGLEIPAVTILEWGKPLASFWAAGLAVGSPLAHGLIQVPWYEHLEAVLGDPSQIEALLCEIEERSKNDGSKNAGSAKESDVK